MLLRVTALLLAGLLAASAAWAAGDDAAFKERLRRVLRENPELILEALWERKAELYRLAREGAREEQRQRWNRGLAQAMKHPLTMLLDESRPVIGPDQAPYTIVEFSDFLCGACALGSRNLDRLMKKHPGQVRLQLKHNPGSELGRQLAVYYEAIGRQGPEMAWRFAKLVFQRQGEIGRRKLEAVQEIVKELKVDRAQLARDLADKALARRIDADKAEAKRLKFLSTPTFVINGVAITGAAPVQAFEEVMAKWKKQQEQASRPTADKEVEQSE